MFGFVKSIFGGQETASKAMDIAGSTISGIGNWIDEKDFTPEEKSKALAKAVEAHLELIKATANENSARSVTRRWLAWGMAGYMLFWASVAMIFSILGKEAIVDKMLDVVIAFNFGLVFLAVMGFYFGVQAFRK